MGRTTNSDIHRREGNGEILEEKGGRYRDRRGNREYGERGLVGRKKRKIMEEWVLILEKRWKKAKRGWKMKMIKLNRSTPELPFQIGITPEFPSSTFTVTGNNHWMVKGGSQTTPNTSSRTNQEKENRKPVGGSRSSTRRGKRDTANEPPKLGERTGQSATVLSPPLLASDYLNSLSELSFPRINLEVCKANSKAAAAANASLTQSPTPSSLQSRRLHPHPLPKPTGLSPQTLNFAANDKEYNESLHANKLAHINRQPRLKDKITKNMGKRYYPQKLMHIPVYHFQTPPPFPSLPSAGRLGPSSASQLAPNSRFPAAADICAGVSGLFDEFLAGLSNPAVGFALAFNDATGALPRSPRSRDTGAMQQSGFIVRKTESSKTTKRNKKYRTNDKNSRSDIKSLPLLPHCCTHRTPTLPLSKLRCRNSRSTVIAGNAVGSAIGKTDLGMQKTMEMSTAIQCALRSERLRLKDSEYSRDRSPALPSPPNTETLKRRGTGRRRGAIYLSTTWHYMTAWVAVGAASYVGSCCHAQWSWIVRLGLMACFLMSG
ncbi:hypothetical protein M5K25_007989 [Dendrobium thyrsiflorum]|uniref:Uncharacterized protein n=1 Tax=Dendrobium thyrsiflorum TaxID=117978 RepID=A0ABD0VES4_DENTH